MTTPESGGLGLGRALTAQVPPSPQQNDRPPQRFGTPVDLSTPRLDRPIFRQTPSRGRPFGEDGDRSCVGDAFRHTDLFPLAVPSIRKAERSMAPSRAMRRRMVERQRIDTLEHDAVVSLNALSVARAGRALSVTGWPPHRASPSASTVEVEKHIRTACEFSYRSRPHGVVDGALCELLKAPSVYEATEQCTRVPMRLDKLNILRGAVRPIDIHRVIGDDARPFAERAQAYMPRSEREQARFDEHRPTPLPYNDPKLRDRRFLRKLVERLHAVGLITWRRRIKSFIGFFAVTKKDGMQRLIGDARAASHIHRRPPYAAMAAPIGSGWPTF